MIRRVASIVSVLALLQSVIVPPSYAQTATSAAAPSSQQFDSQQLDALLAPIALYPDDLVTQILMASTFPLQVVDAARWLADPAHKSLQGAALTKALEPMSWDPSVKSLVPLPQVLNQMNGALDWMQQVGYAFSTQQKDVLDSVQRLRAQAQAQGNLKSTPQQSVTVQPLPSGQQTIVIQPAQPNIVYVPSYNPAVVYGPWPYPTYPPVALPPPPGAVIGTALVAGLAFGAGVAITAGLWGWAQPNWNHGNVNVNVNRYNNINVNRARINSNVWNPANRPGGGYNINRQHPPMGPVGRPVRGTGLPANAIGRPSVNVPGNLVNRPARPNNGAQRLGPMTPGSRPNPGQIRPPAAGGAARPNLPARNGQSHGGAGNRGQQNRPAFQQRQGKPPGNAFGGMGEGNRASGFAQRGQQSRQIGAGRQGGGRQGGGRQGGVRQFGGHRGR